MVNVSGRGEYILEIQSNKLAGGPISTHMQDMSNDKSKLLFLRRKHKLFRSLALPPPQFPHCSTSSQVASLYEAILNKENQASQLDYFIKHELKADLAPLLPTFMLTLWKLLDSRSGSLLAFVVYRLCRKYPASYWPIVHFAKLRLERAEAKTAQQVAFLTDLFLYGFCFTVEEFSSMLFPCFREHVLQLLPRYCKLLESSEFFLLRQQKVFTENLQLWMQAERSKVETLHGKLLEQSRVIQERLVKQFEDEGEELSYINSLERYETVLYKVGNAMHHLGVDFNSEAFKLKSIFELKKECKTFKLSFVYSEYERSLYLKSQEERELQPLRKWEMTRLEESEAFVTRVKLCCSVRECIDLSGYFLQQLNIQHNREELVELIINDCYHYNNLSYILKILLEIAQTEPTLHEYCSSKGRKICGQSRMNPKYQKLLCEMCRFGLMGENILLDYCEKILKIENSQATKEIEAILENLGTMVYYRSLPTHTRINWLFERMEAMMKSKLVHFSMDQLFHLKGLLTYLRSHSNKISLAQTEDMAQLEIKTNFQFILKKMERLLKDNETNKIIDFVAAGVDHQDFLNSYYYASLIKDINHKPLNSQLHEITTTAISESLEKADSQRSICWSRFLGQLYNYEIISRKKLIDNLNHTLQLYQGSPTLTSCLKSICATLETSKFYLKEAEVSKDKREVITFILDIKKVVCLNSVEQLLYDQISEIAEYFHPHLAHFDTIDKIYDLIVLFEHAQSRYSLYTLLDMLQNGADAEQLKNEQKTEKKKYQQKEKQEKKWVEKPVKYKEKEKEKEPIAQQPIPRSDMQRARQSPSKLSIRTDETREGQVQKRQIKVMGRSKADKKIRVVTATYTETHND